MAQAVVDMVRIAGLRQPSRAQNLSSQNGTKSFKSPMFNAIGSLDLGAKNRANLVHKYNLIKASAPAMADGAAIVIWHCGGGYGKKNWISAMDLG
jgi:hypothetical protein